MTFLRSAVRDLVVFTALDPPPRAVAPACPAVPCVTRAEAPARHASRAGRGQVYSVIFAHAARHPVMLVVSMHDHAARPLMNALERESPQPVAPGP